jgi:hypothetical protein
MFSRLGPEEIRSLRLIACAAFVLRAALGLRPQLLLGTRPYIEDSFYAFTCSMHIAAGHGFSVDGVHPTNGVQPLICLLYAPFFYLVQDKWLAIRLTFILQGLIVAAGCYAIAAFVSLIRQEPKSDRSDHAPIIAAVIWGLSISCYLHNTNGLETGLTALLLISSLLQYPTHLDSLRRTILFGVVLGAAVLARLDTAILVVFFALFDLVKRPHQFGRIALYCLTAFVISLPWWIYNAAVFGSLMPISGQLESLYRPYAVNILWLGNVLIDQLSIFYYHPYHTWHPVVTAGGLMVLVAVWIQLLRSQAIRSRLNRYDLSPLAPFVLFCIVLAIYYTLFFSAAHFIDRYLTPLRIMLVVLFSITVSAYWSSATFARKEVRLLSQFATLLLITFTALHFFGQFYHAAVWQDFYQVGEWAASQKEPVGMLQTGLTGFIAPNVINLDGKVNAEALAARKHDALSAYVIQQRIKYLADWPEEMQPIVDGARVLGVNFDSTRRIGSVVIYERN